MNTDNIGRLIAIGARDQHWYRDTEELFAGIYGRERLHFITQLFAATSIKTSLRGNVKLFRKALKELNHDLPFSNYLPVIRFQLDRIRRGEPLKARKIRNFAAAMSGDKNAVVVDRWIMRAFGYDGNLAPTDKQYDEIEQWIQGYAEMTSREPREVCAMIWSGIRKDRVTRYDSVLKSQLTPLFNEKDFGIHNSSSPNLGTPAPVELYDNEKVSDATT